MKKRMTFLLPVLLSLIVSVSCKKDEPANAVVDPSNYANTVADDRMLLVLSAPSIHNNYYSSAFDEIIAFHVEYAKKIMGNDNVVVLTDADTRPYLEGKLPADVLLDADVYDIWMRDFSTVNPENPTQFTYTWASMTKAESEEVQNSFSAFAQRFGLTFNQTNLLLDGGNLVDNYKGKVIVTDRFLTDNNLSEADGFASLKNLLGATEVAIIPADDEILAHSDGMVMWVDDETLLVNDYSTDVAFRTSVMAKLQAAFPTTKIVEVPVEYLNNGWPGFESACGINVNSALTYKNIYVPVFNLAHEEQALALMRENTSKNVIPVPAISVCPMGGSVRCLTWQLTGENARKLIEAARQN